MTLHLSLKEKWFRMIQSGEKREEYREITDYWYKRLTDNGVIKHFDDVHFTLGYPKADDAARHMTRQIADITIGTGRPEWGAEDGKEYFVIKLGARKVLNPELLEQREPDDARINLAES